MANLDFNTLVSRVNPAAQYQAPINHGYPPNGDSERQNIFLIDDDLDEDDKTFTNETPRASFKPAGMVSTESGLPLSKNAAPVAGTSWMDDEPELELPRHTKEPLRQRFKQQWKWRWPWQKEEVLEGDRVIEVNDEQANHLLGFDSNYVSTSKYNPVTFIPKFLLGMLYSSMFELRMSQMTVHRAVLKIRQLILPFHRSYTTSAWSISH
jgi:phospholipid-transporting ATPase